MAGRTTLVGVGSLVSETSARESFAFTNFRIGQIRGWRRAFNQANWVNVANGWGTADSHDVAALAMVPAEPDVVSRVALLDVDADGLKGFYERETGYRIVSTSFRRLNAGTFPNPVAYNVQFFSYTFMRAGKRCAGHVGGFVYLRRRI